MTRIPLLLNKTGQFLIYILFVRREVVLQFDGANKFIWNVWSNNLLHFWNLQSECERKWLSPVSFGSWESCRVRKQLIQFSKQVLAADKQRCTCAAKPQSPPRRDKELSHLQGFPYWEQGGAVFTRVHWTQGHQPHVCLFVLQRLIILKWMQNLNIVLGKISRNNGNLCEHKWR